MPSSIDFESVEAAEYRARWGDGLVDLFLGLSLLWMGAIWLWFEDAAGFAGILPAVAVVPFVAGRTSFLEDRAGYVRFSERRRSWERRNLMALFVGGIVVFALAIGVYALVAGEGTLSDAMDTLAPGLIALLIGLIVSAVATASMMPRFFAYAGLLVVGGLVASALDTNPGAPLFVSGAVITVCGAILLVRFTRHHPVRGAGAT